MGAIVWALIFWWYFHRKKKDTPELPRQSAYNVPLELSYTASRSSSSRAVLLHRGRAGRTSTNEPTTPTWSRRDRVPVELEVRLPQIDLREGGAKYDGVDVAAQAYAEEPAGEQVLRGEEVPPPNAGKSNDISDLRFDKIETVGSSLEEIPLRAARPGAHRVQVNGPANVIQASRCRSLSGHVMPNPEQNHSDNVFQISEITKEGVTRSLSCRVAVGAGVLVNAILITSPDNAMVKRHTTNAEGR